MARVTIFYMKSNKTSWGQVASWYDTMIEEGDGTFQKDVILPNIIRLMNIRPGTRVVDMACGQGFFCP
jgi:ubiquinone/menaquinone biosynthesis C-methylase UbiE